MSFVIAKKKKKNEKRKTDFSNSAEKHFGNYAISNKELDLYQYINVKKINF